MHASTYRDKLRIGFLVAFFLPALAKAELWPYERTQPDPVFPTGDAKATLPPLSGGIANPGFEQGFTGWSRISGAAINTTSSAEGNNHALVSFQYNLSQRFAFDLPSWQSVTIRAMVFPEFPGQSLPIFAQGAPSGTWSLTPRNGFPLGGEWQQGNLAVTKVPGNVELLLLLRTRVGDWWTGIDQLEVLYEGISPSGWEPSAGVTIDGALLTLAPGASTRQDVAHSPDAVHYFLAGEGSGLARLSEVRRNRINQTIDSPTTSTVVALEPRFLWEPGRATADVATVSVDNPTTSPTTLRLSRGWTVAWPESFEPVANSPSPTIRFGAAWPGELGEARVEILLPEGDIVATLEDLQRDASSVWVEYDGADLEAGNYRARFVLTSTTGFVIAPERTFSLRRGPDYTATPAAARFDGFQRMPWLFFDDRPEDLPVVTVERATELLQLVKDDGFNLALIICPPTRVEMFVEAAEAVDLPFVLGVPAAWMTNPQGFGNATFDPEVYRRQMDPIYGPWREHPLIRGYMLVDEANLSANLARDYTRAQLHLERLGYPPGFTFIAAETVTNGAVPPVHLAHFYGFNYSDYARWLEDLQLATARSTGRDFWFGPQAWARPSDVPGATPAQASITLGMGLAMGARGYYTFLYTTLNFLGGIRTADFAETARTATYRDFNHRVEALVPLLATLSTERERPEQSGIYARVARDPSNRPYLFLVNQLERQSVQVQVDLSDPADATDAETGDPIPLDVPMVLAPGQWRVVRIDRAVDVTRVAGIGNGEPGQMPAGLRFVRSWQVPENRSSAVAIGPDLRFASVISGGVWSLYDLSTEPPTQRASRFVVNQSWSSTRFADARTVLQGTNTWGFEGYNIAESGAATPFLERVQRTSAGHTMVPVGDGDWWSSRSFVGVSRIRFGANDRVGSRVAHWFPRQYGMISMHGPLPNGDVIGVDYVHGPYRFSFDGTTITDQRLSGSSLWSTGSMSADGRRFAFGRWDRGLVLYRLAEDGNVVLDREILNPDSPAVGPTAWIDSEHLLVADRVRGIMAYRVPDSGGWEFLGVWAPPTGLVSAVDAHPTGVLVGTTDRTVYLLDPSPILNAHPAGWMLTGE